MVSASSSCFRCACCSIARRGRKRLSELSIVDCSLDTFTLIEESTDDPDWLEFVEIFTSALFPSSSITSLWTVPLAGTGTDLPFTVTFVVPFELSLVTCVLTD